jgi:hypothetical protein
MTKRPYDERREVLGGLALDGRSVKVPPRFVHVEVRSSSPPPSTTVSRGVVAKRVASR